MWHHIPKRNNDASRILEVVIEARASGSREKALARISEAIHAIWEVVPGTEIFESRPRSVALRRNPEAGPVIDHPVPQEYLAGTLYDLPNEDLRVSYVEAQLQKYAFYCLITEEERNRLVHRGISRTMPRSWNKIDRFARYSEVGISIGEGEIFCRDELRQILSAPYAPFYVYQLRNPKGNVFYIGKGEKLRALSHEKELFKRSYRVHTNWKKLNKIAQIVNTGKFIKYEIESWHFDEAQAFLREGELILLAERENPWLLTNSNGRRWSGKPNRHLKEIRERRGLAV